MISYAATTEEVTVTVRPLYLDEQSNAISQEFAFGYYVHVGNHGNDEVQIVENSWYIHDATGRTREHAQSSKVVRRPVIPPGDYHEFGAYCVIPTFEGTLEGSFLLERSNGERFRAHTPATALRALTN